MPSDIRFVEFVVDQIDPSMQVKQKFMFGEYAIYYNSKVVALICDNRLLIKPTAARRAYIGDIIEAPPYPGAKLAFLIEEKIDDTEWLSELIRITEKELPKKKIN